MTDEILETLETGDNIVNEQIDYTLQEVQDQLQEMENEINELKFRNIIKPSVSKDYSNSEIDVPISDISDDELYNLSNNSRKIGILKDLKLNMGIKINSLFKIEMNNFF